MANKRAKPEEIVAKLRQVEVLMGQGMPHVDAIRQIEVTEQTYYRWRRDGGGTVEGTEAASEGERASARGGFRSYPRQGHSLGSCPGNF